MLSVTSKERCLGGLFTSWKSFRCFERRGFLNLCGCLWGCEVIAGVVSLCKFGNQPDKCYDETASVKDYLWMDVGLLKVVVEVRICIFRVQLHIAAMVSKRIVKLLYMFCKAWREV